MCKPTPLLSLLLLLPLCGCFSQRSFPADLELVRTVDPLPSTRPHDARTWLTHTHAQLADLLPPGSPAALLTEDLVDADGRPIDVFEHFDRNPETLHTLFGNLTGLTHSAQAAGADTSEQVAVPPWPGFEDVWVPVADDLEYAARFGIAREADGTPRNATCVVILPGILGDLAVWRTRDIALALRSAGVHVLAVELRGMGGTNRRYPDKPVMFGALETDDLIACAVWLQSHDFVRDTGLIGFCWGANHALVTAWTLGRLPGDPDLEPGLARLMRPLPDEPVYAAGMLAFSPVLRFEEIVAACERPIGVFDHPALNSLQGTVRGRMEQKRHREISGNLLRCIELEAERDITFYPGMVSESLRFLRMLPHEDRPCGPKLNVSPIPLLIVQAEDDPLTEAQNVADLIAVTHNPNVAAVVLPGGGHVGFAPYARDYFYSLLLGFFDAETGPTPVAVRD